MGKKYVIELEDEPFSKGESSDQWHVERSLWKVKGFNSLVFDENGIKKLQPLSDAIELVEHETYASAFNDGYKLGLEKLMRAYDAIILHQDDGGLDVDDLVCVFGTSDVQKIIKSFNPTEIIERLDAYRKKNEEEKYKHDIKAGDEVVSIFGTKAICSFSEYDTIGIIFADGSCGDHNKLDWVKTGERYPELLDMLKKVYDKNHNRR